MMAFPIFGYTYKNHFRGQTLNTGGEIKKLEEQTTKCMECICLNYSQQTQALGAESQLSHGVERNQGDS